MPDNTWVILGATVCMAVLISGLAGGATTAQTGQQVGLSSCTTISESGSYDLTQNISTDTEDVCLRIEASDVVLNGNGHEIEGEGLPETTGIEVTGDNVTVRNVVVSNFDTGLQFTRAANGQAEEVTARLNNAGIYYRRGSNGEIVDSTAYANGGLGIASFGTDQLLIKGNNASNNFGDGIWVNSGWTVVDNVARNNDDKDILVRNIEPDETTLVRNNTAGFAGMFIGRTGTIANNDVEDLRVSEAWNVTVRDNEISDRLTIRRVNDSTFSDNTVGSEIYIVGGFRSMSGTDRRTVCSRGVLVEDTVVTDSRGPDTGITVSENATGATVRGLEMGEATVTMTASRNVTIRTTDPPASNPDGSPLGGYLTVSPRQQVGQATVAISYDDSALGDSEGAVLYRYTDGWEGLESYVTDDGTVGSSLSVTSPTTVAGFSVDSERASDFRVETPTDVSVQCGPTGSSVTVVRNDTTVRTSNATASESATLPVPLLAGGVLALVLVAGIGAVGMRRMSDDSVPNDAGSDVDGEAAAGPSTAVGSAATPLTIENSAFDKLHVRARIQPEDGEPVTVSADVEAGETHEIHQVTATGSVRIDVSVEDGPTESVSIENGPDTNPVRVRTNQNTMEINRGTN